MDATIITTASSTREKYILKVVKIAFSSINWGKLKMSYVEDATKKTVCA